MKYISKITLGLILCTALVTSCKDDDEPGIEGLALDKTEITMGAEGGVEKDCRIVQRSMGDEHQGTLVSHFACQRYRFGGM